MDRTRNLENEFLTLSSEKDREAITSRNQIDLLVAEKEKNELDLMRNKDEIQKLTSQIETLNDNIKYNLGISEEYRVETDDKIEKLNTEKKHLKDELSQKDEDNQKLREKISRLKTSGNGFYIIYVSQKKVFFM